MPPSFMRSVASAKSPMIRSMSQSSASLGKARCAGSRCFDDDTEGSQSPLDQPVRRPRCVSWIITAQPWSWQASVSLRIQGTTSSL